MTEFSLLRDLAREQVSLQAAVAPRVRGIVLERGRACSGITWHDDLIVTAAEAVAGSRQVAVLLAEGEAAGEVIAVDLATDVAVVRVAGKRAGAGTGTSGELAPVMMAAARPGEPVLVAGRRGALQCGQWSSLQAVGPAWRSRRGGEISQRLEFSGRFDTALEGAAVFNVEGALLAMAVTGPQRRAIGIPVDTIERVLTVVGRHGYLPRPWLGVRLQSVWLDDAVRAQVGHGHDRIALVAGVQPDSPAAQAGIEFADLILALDGEPVPDATALARRLGRSRPGETLSIEVRRGGKSLSLAVHVGEAPSSRSAA